MSQPEDRGADARSVEEPAAEAEPSLLGSPLIRLALVIVVLALVVAAVGFFVYTQVNNARRQPIAVDIYPGASLRGQMLIAPGNDRLWYVTQDDAETVAAFYRERYNHGEDQRCVRVENALRDPSLPAFEERCVIDNSTINAHQSATIAIQPHTAGEYAGHTVIFIERFWQE